MTALAEAPAAPSRRRRSPRLCDFPECDRPHRANGLCNAHNEQSRRGRELTRLRLLPRYAWTYVVYWPDALGPGMGVLKVGRSWSRWRVKGMLDAGARLISNTGNTDESWERWALRFLALEYRPAFRSAAEAEDLLWRGRGYTECFAVAEDDVYEAMDLIVYGYSFGNERGVNDLAAYRPDSKPRTAEPEPVGHAAHNQRIADEATRQKEAPSVSNVSAEARVTARALWLMSDGSGRRRIDLDELAAKIYPYDDLAAARDAIALHILMLEDAGYLATYATEDGEWIQLRKAMPGPESSTAIGGERERARERAQERVRSERANTEHAWADLRSQWSGERPDSPRPPASMKAPPLGCHDHPHGSLFPCGPCGTARRQYDAFLDAQRFEDKLADHEFWNRSEGAPDDDDQPF